MISPYLDQQLTGAQMIEIARHLETCPACAEECESIRQVKRMLRTLSTPQPSSVLPSQIERRLSTVETEKPLSFSFSSALPSTRPQRGRRLATAFALSCFTILALSAPFAPASIDAPHHWPSEWPRVSQSSHPQVFWAITQRTPMMMLTQDRLAAPLTVQEIAPSSESRQDMQFAEQYADPSLRQRELQPLTDEASSAYGPGDASFASFQEP